MFTVVYIFICFDIHKITKCLKYDSTKRLEQYNKVYNNCIIKSDYIMSKLILYLDINDVIKEYYPNERFKSTVRIEYICAEEAMRNIEN